MTVNQADVDNFGKCSRALLPFAMIRSLDFGDLGDRRRGLRPGWV